MDEAKCLSTLGEFAELYNAMWRRFRTRLGTRCFLCEQRCSRLGLCEHCNADLPHRGATQLRRQLPFITATYVAFDYRYPLDKILHKAKFSSDLAALALCARLLEMNVSAYLPQVDWVIPVPLSKRRYLTRAYNQAHEIARPLARQREVRLAADYVWRCSHRTAQSTLPAAARANNIAGAFACRKSLAGADVLIVDDVITTGTTVTELARTLSRSGARHIYVAALAATSAG